MDMIELARTPGVFGPIRVMQRQNDGARAYLVGASLQTLAMPDGESLFGYVHAIALLLRDAPTTLVIGGAGASLATMLARKDTQVTVIDIEPAAYQLAKDYFGLSSRVEWVCADALDFVVKKGATYDAIVVDACDQISTVDHFLKPEWIAQAMTRLRPNGSLVLNLANAANGRPQGEALAKALCYRGLFCLLLRPEDGWEGNELLHVSRSAFASGIEVGDALSCPAEARSYLLSLHAYAFPAQDKQAKTSPVRTP